AVIRSTTDSDWKKSIQNFSEIRWSATVFRSVREEILQSLWNQLLSTTDRSRWDIMRHRNSIRESRRTLPREVIKERRTENEILFWSGHRRNDRQNGPAGRRGKNR